MSTGPTGVAGIFGQQGIGLRGPTGLQGIQGITGPNFGVTGPTGGAGNAGVSLPITGQVISMSTYGTGVAGVATPAASDSTVVTVWQAAIPSEAKGKSGMLSTYFDMTLNYPTSGTTFDYGVYIDGVSTGLGPTQLARYVQTVFSTNLMGSNQTLLGTNAPSPVNPLSRPVTISSIANNVQIRIANSSASIPSLTTSNLTAYTTTGSNTYTTPSNAIGIMVYVWGCGGSPFQTNAGGPGGFASGFYSCASGTVFTTIVGSLGGGTTSFSTGCGGQGVSGTLGAGGGFSAVFLGTAPSSNTNNPIVVAGGGGGCSQTASSTNQWQGGGGGGLNGGNTYDTFSSVYSANGQGNGGTQTAAGYAAAKWQSYQYNNTNGAGGGGFYGGGGGNGTMQAGGGGSGFLLPGLAYGYSLQGSNSIATRTIADISANVVAPANDIMRSLGYNGYGHGSGGTGLVLIVPVTGSNNPLVNVDMRFATL